ncbi:transposase domain-containing protein [Streptomyces albidoflavus]|nr:transposase domain-containing protein [Streptomyces albidoflavus]
MGRRAAGADRDPDEGVTVELVDAAIAKHDRAEQRRRLLPARLVVYFVLALCLFARESYEEVLRVLTSGIPGSRALARVNRSSLSRARACLGEDVLGTVFRQVAGPLATPATPGAWWRGLRLLALDGTQFDLPDSTSNGDTFDDPSTTGGVPFGFPQVGGPRRDRNARSPRRPPRRLPRRRTQPRLPAGQLHRSR